MTYALNGVENRTVGLVYYTGASFAGLLAARRSTLLAAKPAITKHGAPGKGQ